MKTQYTFATREAQDWITSGRLFDTIEEAGNAAKEWLVVAFENGLCVDVRLITHREA